MFQEVDVVGFLKRKRCWPSLVAARCHPPLGDLSLVCETCHLEIWSGMQASSHESGVPSRRDNRPVTDLTETSEVSENQERRSGDPKERIGRYARRVGVLATEIERAHQLGEVEGGQLEPWKQGFQSSVVQVYSDTLPDSYLRRVALEYEDCAREMDAVELPDMHVEDWQIVQSYLCSVSNAIWAMPRVQPKRVWERPELLSPSPPALLRYDLLAAVVHPDGVARLSRAAGATLDLCQRWLSGRPSDDSVELLRQIRLGRPRIEVASNAGWSERTLHRRLRDLCIEMGEPNPAGLVLRGVRDGWL